MKTTTTKKRVRKKSRNRICFSVALAPDLNERFLHYCSKRDINKTKAIQELLDEHLPMVRVVKRGVD